CYDIQGIGFRTADRIALKYGIPRESPLRIKAGIVYALSETTERGHVCTPAEILVSKASMILDVPDLKIRDMVEGLLLDGDIMAADFSGRRFVYLGALYEAETLIAEHVRALSSATERMNISDIPKAVKWFEKANGISLAEEQKTALIYAMKEKILIITGGPGTGKTTLIKGIIEVCERRGIHFELCAPTGRAAKRMAEATGRNAQTIHRLFEITPLAQEDHGVTGRKIKTDMLIIDEASMVDTVLFSRILKGIEDGTALILVGDADQLPSVGPGNVLKDIIRSGMVKTIRLTTIFRQGQESLIVINAHRINQGLLPQEKENEKDGDFFLIHRDNPEDIIDVVKELVAHRIPKRFGFDPIKDIQVLSPMHRGIVGVENLNAELQLLLNPSG
ncbi:ATP-dependent RecD-like DNA helicase, partial [archaeon]|nr:ATP-dependent RecD-like DNA helicase [archaeon]